METEEDFVFECILQPSILDEKLLNKSTKNEETVTRAYNVLRELLVQLSAVTKAHIAVNAEGNAHDTGSLKKKAYIQLMALRIASFLSWDISELNDCPALQLLLLETLLTVTDQTEASVEIDGKILLRDNPPGKKFAFMIYHRWVLHTLPL